MSSIKVTHIIPIPFSDFPDGVKVIKGQVEPNFEAAATLPFASAALVASQAGRTPTPAPQEGRAW